MNTTLIRGLSFFGERLTVTSVTFNVYNVATGLKVDTVVVKPDFRQAYLLRWSKAVQGQTYRFSEVDVQYNKHANVHCVFRARMSDFYIEALSPDCLIVETSEYIEIDLAAELGIQDACSCKITPIISDALSACGVTAIKNGTTLTYTPKAGQYGVDNVPVLVACDCEDVYTKCIMIRLQKTPEICAAPVLKNPICSGAFAYSCVPNIIELCDAEGNVLLETTANTKPDALIAILQALDPDGTFTHDGNTLTFESTLCIAQAKVCGGATTNITLTEVKPLRFCIEGCNDDGSVETIGVGNCDDKCAYTHTYKWLDIDLNEIAILDGEACANPCYAPAGWVGEAPYIRYAQITTAPTANQTLLSCGTMITQYPVPELPEKRDGESCPDASIEDSAITQNFSDLSLTLPPTP